MTYSSVEIPEAVSAEADTLYGNISNIAASLITAASDCSSQETTLTRDLRASERNLFGTFVNPVVDPTGEYPVDRVMLGVQRLFGTTHRDTVNSVFLQMGVRGPAVRLSLLPMVTPTVERLWVHSLIIGASDLEHDNGEALMQQKYRDILVHGPAEYELAGLDMLHAVNTAFEHLG